jgi:hypothetical protein
VEVTSLSCPCQQSVVDYSITCRKTRRELCGVLLEQMGVAARGLMRDRAQLQNRFLRGTCDLIIATLQIVPEDKPIQPSATRPRQPN